MAKINAVKTEAEEHDPSETVGHYEIRTGKDHTTGKELSSVRKMSTAHLMLNPRAFAIRDLVDFADGLALILSCADGDKEEWGEFAAMVEAPLRTVVDKAKSQIDQMEMAHSVLGDILKSLEK